MPETEPAIRRALISVSDKTGAASFARELAGQGVEVISTGGTATLLRDSGIAVRDISEVTGFPEIMDGRVKTLHPLVHGALLGARDNPEHAAAMDAHGITPIDLLAVNLYPFEQTVQDGADFAACIENIDIGGPALIRAAAKNHAHVTVVVDPDDYTAVLDEIRQHGHVPPETRRTLAAKAYARTAAYDAAVTAWFAVQTGETAPKWRSFSGTLKQTLRYGENAHQHAAFYVGGTAPSRPGVATARQVQGKELSYNNINDTDAAYELVAEFNPDDSAAVAIIKHANPCGVALGDTLAEAYDKALLSDRVSAFGGIIAVNRELDAEAAAKMMEIFTEVIIAPGADPQALDVIAQKKNTRLLLAGGLPDPAAEGLTVRSVSGGLLVQSRDNGRVGAADVRCVTRRAPTERELADLIFAFRVCKHVKSNAIVYARDGATVGIGAGQMSRVDSARIAAHKAQESARAKRGSGLDDEKPSPAEMPRGMVAASDAFFPFPDGLLATAQAGATAVIQPGGSMRDEDVIAAADEEGLAMVLTGMRHFRH
ncbi:MAG: bifunctional phosphoribosylaminoimidazolecarboxamide formyltransferase/IMP cyclohydrolase [Dichotomicrobium sp.]